MLKNAVIPKHVQSLLLRLLAVLFFMTIARLIFYGANASSFIEVTLADFLGGVWMDAIAIGIWYMPFYLLALLPFPFTVSRFYRIFLRTLYLITSVCVLGLNLMDVEYYKYTSKRSTADIFDLVSAGNDFNQLFTTFITDFWWLIALFIGFLIVINKCYSLFSFPSTTLKPYPYLKRIAHFFIVGTLLFIVGRGGIGYRPADMLTAAKITRPENTALVNNTPLSIIKTIGKTALLPKNYFETDSSKIYTPIHRGSGTHQTGEDLNIVVIVLESFGNEWLGKASGKPFTPFLDSLLGESLYFSNAFANGKKSIEAVPAIFAGIPSLMENPYISSPYGMNRIQALPHLLKSADYESAFYHGATNGSMKFDVFAAHAGFDKYFGRKEYDNDEHFDGTWGIMDEYFMPWTASSITQELEEPFLASLFTISSHHPYFVPEAYRDKLPKGSAPLAQATAYADMSLSRFFERAQKQPWYENTIFVLCADHTPAGTSSYYTRRIGMYRIPIAFYDPKGRIPKKEEKQLFNQIDITPTLLDMIGWKDDVYTFGNSWYERQQEPFVVNFISNTYHYLEGDYMLNYVDDEVTGLYNYKEDSLMRHDSLSFYPGRAETLRENLRGFIQRYNHDLIFNSMTIQ
ncbi:MAG: LTA synthase family protein [Bacteroidota bacterium]